jgi:hypothetical protein
MDTTAEVTKRCPRCGHPNGCAIASGDGFATCWCADVTANQTTLAALPIELRSKACLCRGCLCGGTVAEDCGQTKSIGGSEQYEPEP